MPRQRKVPSFQAATTQVPATRRALREKTNISRSTAPVYENDGTFDDLVKDAEPTRLRTRQLATAARHGADEFVMTGGLGRTASDASVPSETTAPTTDDLLHDDAPQVTAARPNRRPARTKRKLVQSKADSEVLEGVRHRMQATAREQRLRAASQSVPAGSPQPSPDILVRKSPEVEVAPLSEKSASAKLAAKRASLSQPPGSVLKLQNTPAMETSILALKNFKRRPRQPSMLLMVQQRTASAAPTPAKITSVEDSFSYDLDAEDEDEDENDDFAPEVEGTPLNMRPVQRDSFSVLKRLGAAQEIANPKTAIAETRKRKSDEADVSTGSLSASRAKRSRPEPSRSCEPEMDSPAASLEIKNRVQSSPGRPSTPPALVDSEILVINSETSSSPLAEPISPYETFQDMNEPADVVRSTGEEYHHEEEEDLVRDGRAIQSKVADETMAEPASSSPAAVDHSGMTNDRDIYAEPVSQFSPSQKRTTKAARKEKPLTTAALQNLLPRRRRIIEPRRQRRTEYDFESVSDQDPETSYDASHLEDDEDELGGRLRTKTRTPAPRSKKSTETKASATASKKSRQSKSITAAKSAASHAARDSNVTQAKNTGPRKYGRRPAHASDKENDNVDEAEESILPDMSITMLEASRGKELEDAKLKFADIDGWDMDFESMSFEDHRSSSQGWR